MKILNLDPWNFSEKAKSIYAGIGNYMEQLNISREQLKREIADVDILVLRLSHFLDEDILTSALQLKYIVTNCTGLDHIDSEYCKQFGIEIISLKGEFEFLRSIHATAELTWGLLLDSFRHISKAQWHIQNNGEWERDLFFGNELHGKSIGILGFGRIGEKISNFAHCFGMNVLAYDPTPLSKPAYVNFFPSIDDFLSSDIDVLSLHVSYSKDTHHLINSAALENLNSSVTIINTSRGAVVDENAIVEALSNHRIKCYATDVIENETDRRLLHISPLLKARKEGQNILVTPHIGGVTYESWHKTEEFCAMKVNVILGLHD